MKNDDDSTKALLWSYELIIPDEKVSLEKQSYDELQEKLAVHLDHLLTTDFNKLISILYRIDISQEKAMASLAENAKDENAGQTLARLIIERQLEKVKTRREFRKY